MLRHIFTAVVGLCITGASLNAQDRFLGKSGTEWVAQLKNSADSKQRRHAAFALGKVGSRAVEHLPEMKIAFTREKDTKVREALVYAMGEISRHSIKTNGDIDLERIFISATANQDAYVRRSGVFALGCLGNKSRESIQALETAMGDQQAFVRQNAAWALGQFGEAALPILKKGLRDQDSLVKRDAANALMQMQDPDKVHDLLPELLPLCRDANSETKRSALNVLVRIVNQKDRDAIAPLRAALGDRDLEVKRNAALALSNIGGDETAVAMPVLLEAIKNGELDVRRQAVAAFRNIGPAAAQAVPSLIDLLRDDKDTEVRGYAAFALSGMGQAAEPAVPLLVQKIQDTKEASEIRIQCAMAMARIGPVPAAVKAVPGLLEVLGNATHETKVRERVMWALRVHAEDLRNMNGTKDTFTRILGEPLNDTNRMLRYDAAYMLGMIWHKQAPEATLDILTEFLKDDSIKIFDRTVSGVSGAGIEGPNGKAAVEERGKGDGRIMAVDALRMMGPGRYASRPAIMAQLRVIAADPTSYEPLRKKSMALIAAK